MTIRAKLVLATADQIAGDQPVKTSLNFNPLAVAYDTDRRRMAATSYSQPGVWLGTLDKNKNGDLVWDTTLIGGAKAKHHSRLFPAGVPHSRAQCVMIEGDGFWLSYNGGTEFFCFSPTEDGTGWRLAGKTYLPGSLDNDNRMVHAAYLYDFDLWTIESDDAKLEQWFLRRWCLDEEGNVIGYEFNNPVASFTYGIGKRDPDDSDLWTVTDARSKERHGIYCGNKLVVPEVTGTGLVFLNDGSAIVACYSDLDQIDKPGAFVFVPAKMFEGK